MRHIRVFDIEADKIDKLCEENDLADYELLEIIIDNLDDELLRDFGLKE